MVLGNMKQQTLLLTGGAGFIGLNFILYLREKYPDYKIICLDKFTYAANRQVVEKLCNPEHFVLINGDICDRNTVSLRMLPCEPLVRTPPPKQVQTCWLWPIIEPMACPLPYHVAVITMGPINTRKSLFP